MTFGDRIKAKRSEYGWSQEQLAARAGVSQQLVAKLELGDVTETRKLQKIAKALSMTAEDLLNVDAGEPTMPKQFGRLIREKRKAQGMTQSQLADRIGVTKGAISHWEKGRVEGIDPTNLHWLAQVLFLSDADLKLFAARPKLEFAELPPFPQSEMEVIHKYAALPENARRPIREMIELLSTSNGDRHEQEAGERGQGPHPGLTGSPGQANGRSDGAEDHAGGSRRAIGQGGCGTSQDAEADGQTAGDSEEEKEKNRQVTLRQKFDAWYASPRGELQFQQGMHYLGWAYVCYAEGYKQAAIDKREAQ